MEDKVLSVSHQFWTALENADVTGMRAIADPQCMFVHIGGTCPLDQEMAYFENGTFQPTKITINSQTVHAFDDTVVVITDCDYGLLLDGEPTTHHFAVTEVYQQQQSELKLIQFTFTALVY